VSAQFWRNAGGPLDQCLKPLEKPDPFQHGIDPVCHGTEIDILVTAMVCEVVTLGLDNADPLQPGDNRPVQPGRAVGPVMGLGRQKGGGGGEGSGKPVKGARCQKAKGDDDRHQKTGPIAKQEAVTGKGEGAVAGFGVASRVEAFAIIPLFALSGSMGPITGQSRRR